MEPCRKSGGLSMDGQIQVIELGDSIGFRPLEAGNVRAVCGRYAQPSPPEIGKGEAEADRDHHRLLTLILGPHLAGPTHQPIGWDASGHYSRCLSSPSRPVFYSCPHNTCLSSSHEFDMVGLVRHHQPGCPSRHEGSHQAPRHLPYSARPV